MSKKNADIAKIVPLVYEVDPTECPFREFRDSELSPELWGLGPAACRATILMSKTAPKPPADYIWVDDHTQPLPRSVRHYLNGWIRAEDLARSRWDAEVTVFEDNNGGKMSIAEMQLTHTQVLMRSSFCRKVLSACYILERVEGLMVEHQWENFNIAIVDGWRARYHIYSPGSKAGGGQQHRPGLSKNGCYLVRLFYLGAWRCVWVSDQVPVDATDSPLLPFSPPVISVPTTKGKMAPAPVVNSEVQLWPLLLCKALLKLAAPDMNSDEERDDVNDELLSDFDVLHALTGCLNLTVQIQDAEELWKLLVSEVTVFSWDDDDADQASTVKSKSTKKPTNKENVVTRRCSVVTILIEDTKNYPTFTLPGITPGHEMTLLISLARDLPLKKPLPEPEVALWKYYRWIDWARQHGLYEAYDCPRTKFLKVTGLMKLSYAPHMLDVQSTESITYGFREEQDKTNPQPPVKLKGGKELTRSQTGNSVLLNQQAKDELREWILYEALYQFIKDVTISYYPSMFVFTSAASAPPIRITKSSSNKTIDIAAPKSGPLYLQIDSPDENNLKISLSVLHPRIMINSGIPIVDYIEPAYVILEKFDWFTDCDVPIAKAFVQTRSYESVAVEFLPGRFYCRLWVHSRLNWHVMLLSESTLLLGTRDVVLAAAVRECPWAAKFLNNLGTSFSGWIRTNRSILAVSGQDKDFFRSYQPDLVWDPDVVGYQRALLHWMFRQALQALLQKRLSPLEYRSVCTVLRHYLSDPDFGLPPKPQPPKSLRNIVAVDPCDCVMPEAEEIYSGEEHIEEQTPTEEKPLIHPDVMVKLLTQPSKPITSQVCELSTEEIPCGKLKDERLKVLKRHDAATFLQAHWRGAWARKCLNVKISFTPETIKSVMEHAFGNLEALSALMNMFFFMYPGAKSAYSVASALSGTNGLHQHHGSNHVTPKCKWIPYFQGVFYCHSPVKVHFDVHSTLQHSTLCVYNNDTGRQMPQAYNAHITFDFSPNKRGYTVFGHGTINKPIDHNLEVFWQLTILTSVEGAFHLCDNDFDGCKELTLPSANKLHLDEIFIPNRRNILGGILISVTGHEAISFRAAATSAELDIVATLRTTTPTGEVEVLSRCKGKGEIYWPYIRLSPTPPGDGTMAQKRSESQHNLFLRESTMSSARSLKAPKQYKPSSAGGKRSVTKFKEKTVAIEPKQYHIEVTTPTGWPLTLSQWKRVDEVRNSPEFAKIEMPKKVVKEKSTSAKDKDKDKEKPLTSTYQPQPDDAYIELECSLAAGGGATARRDDERDIEFAAARRSWDAKEPGRNSRGAHIRNEFRSEFLVALPPPPSESVHSFTEEAFGEEILGEEEKKDVVLPQGPTPATESGLLEMTVEIEEEAKYLLMPEQLKDKFIPLYFLPFCMKDKIEDESVLVTPDMAEAARQDRHARIEAAIERMKELQNHNETSVLGQQKKRCHLLETLFVGCEWCPELAEVLEERDDAIAQETLNRTLSANKKKMDQKKK